VTEQEFIEYLKKLNIEATQKQIEQLEKYYQLLIEWNEKINLTAITEKNRYI
jgi:16S rRNA (guanine527-N7)-methyltransferase